MTKQEVEDVMKKVEEQEKRIGKVELFQRQLKALLDKMTEEGPDFHVDE